MTRYVFGVPRSGSTLAYNLVRLLTGDECAHTHSFVRRDETLLPIVCTFRDFRDSAVSQWIRKGSNGAEACNYEDLLPYLTWLQEFILNLNRYRHEYPPDMVCFIRYRRWALKVREYAVKLCRELEIDGDIEAAVEQCSLVAMRRHAADREQDYKLGVDHINLVEPGMWRGVVVPEDHDRVTQHFRRELELWGFEL